MGLAAEELSWYQQLGHVVKARVHPEGVPANRLGDVPQDNRQWCAFEFADLMEQGIAPGLTSSFAEPLENPTAENRLRVERRSGNKREYVLLAQDGEPLLLARANSAGDQYDIFIARAGEQTQSSLVVSALGPAFVLVAKNSKLREWTLHSTRCERCTYRGRRACGQRELAKVVHYMEPVGEGQALCMDVDVPAPLSSDQGGSAVWCSVCGEADQGEALVTTLTSRRPRWSPKQRTLTLDFRGRCSVASSKNFQLEALGENQNPDCKLLFGKVGDNKFVLDYKSPFGPVQAFATALTASHWK
jgi:hypothetical protein